VDDLDLGVRDRRLTHRVHIVSVDVLDQIVDQRRHLIGRRRDEMRVER